MSDPLTQIKICSGVRLDNRYQHTIYFATREAQQAYFAGKVVRTFPACYHHRRNWEIKLEATVATAQGWNYLYVVNPGVKPYYYFINEVEYVGETTVKLHLELDVIQTNLFDMELLPCFVERQHTPTDEIGDHTIPEGLEMGPYQNYHVYDMDSNTEMGILAMSSLDLVKAYIDLDNGPFGDTKIFEKCMGVKVDGVYSGLGIYAFNKVSNLNDILKALDDIGKSDAIVSIWMYPKNMLKVDDGDGTYECDWADYPWESSHCAKVIGVQWRSTSIPLYNNYSNIFGGYSPKNKKLYAYPYNMLYCTNNQGDKAEYRFEWFSGIEPHYLFRLYGAVSPDAGVKLAPDLYNVPVSIANYDEGITIAGYPQCAWDSDAYKVWLAQNYNQISHAEQTATVAGLTGLGTMIAGVATLNPAMAIGGLASAYHGYSQITGIMAQKDDAKAQPPQAKGSHSTTVNVAGGRQTFTFYYKCVRKEYAQQIDDYFTMFGYRVNRVQKPVINARPNFTFVKTVGCKVWGNLCTDDITSIEQIFDNGVTFWSNGDNIGNYTLDNTPVQEE